MYEFPKRFGSRKVAFFWPPAHAAVVPHSVRGPRGPAGGLMDVLIFKVGFVTRSYIYCYDARRANHSGHAI